MLKKAIVSLVFCLFFFASCSKSGISTSYSSGEYENAYNKAVIMLSTRLDDDALFYKSLSASRLGYIDRCLDSARLYLLLFNKDNDRTIAMERMILYYGNPSESLQVGEELYSRNSLTKDDSIQYYKLLMDSSQQDRANQLLENIYPTLTSSEYTFCLINGCAPTWQVLDSLRNLYKESGSSDVFLQLVRFAILKLDRETDLRMMQEFLEETFDGNTEYAIILGDFFYDANNSDKTRFYWNIAQSDYPEAIDVRLQVIAL